MISAWKRFINKAEGQTDSPHRNGLNGTPPGVQKLDKELQRKFARGVNYNMKIVIKGDAKVGKTSLFLRLKGYGFEENYNPTENLNVTSIDWSYKATDDIVKIDLWEAIDSTSRKRVNFVDLKLENKADKITSSDNGNRCETTNGNTDERSTSKITITNTILSMNGSTLNPIPESAHQSLSELSENFDVYRNTNAVLLVMDMTKSWTFKYIQSELPRIPKHIPVLVIANHRDQGHHRTVSVEQVTAFIDGLDRSHCDGTVMYAEASMKNGFGLKLIDKFFNIPFLKLQEASMVKQLEINRCGYVATLEELKILQESTSREYDQFIELETIKRRQQADAMSPVNSGLRQLDEVTREQIRNTAVSSDRIDASSNVKSIESRNERDQTDARTMASQTFVNDRLPSIVIGAKSPLPETHKSLKAPVAQTVVEDDKNENTGSKDEDDSDEEEVPKTNPLVAGYQSDLDSDDQLDSGKPEAP